MQLSLQKMKIKRDEKDEKKIDEKEEEPKKTK